MSFEHLSERLFVSLALPEPCRDALSDLMQPIEGVRWTRPEQLHLTLRFLGDILDDQTERIVAELRRIQVQSFVLPLEGVGVFPPRGTPKILWAGTGRAHTRLYQLRQRVDDALLAAGWQGDIRTFEPHITVGRVTTGNGGGVQTWLRDHRDFAGPPFRVASFQLMASELTSHGAIHRVHTDFALTS